MKKWLSILFAALLCAVLLCGCKTTKKTESTAFVKPAKYASTIEVTINPEIRLYLTKTNRSLPRNT